MTEDNRDPLGTTTIEYEGDDNPRYIDITSDDAELVFDALSSTTSREIYGRVREEPLTPSQLASEVGTSVQNIHYHLRNLCEADLVTEVGTGYSKKGVEVSMYGPADDPLVLGSGSEETTSTLRAILTRYLGVITIFGALSLLVQQGITAGWFGFGEYDWVSTSTDSPPAPGLAEPGILATLPPGVVFFCGGITMIVLYLSWLKVYHSISFQIEAIG